MNDITLHIATVEDAEDLAISRVHFLTELVGQQPQPDADGLTQELVAYFRNAVAAQQYVGIIARRGDKLVATGGMVFREQPGSFKNPSGKTAYILNMYTIPGFRRRGISSSVMEKLMEIAQGKGYSFFELHATPDGEPMYKKLGFYKHSEPTYRKSTRTTIQM
ncbi:MAG: GNAT family N-acetyltransferase [Taibaiella sp.]|nr:GNAT family N-acetyltransferase [Taibaiella sp.]